MFYNRDDQPLNLLLQFSFFRSDFRCSASIRHYLALRLILGMLPGSGTSLSQQCSCHLHLEACPCAVSTEPMWLTSKKNEHGSWDLRVFRDVLSLLHFSVQVKGLQRYWVSKKTSHTLTLDKGRGHSLCCQVTIGAQWGSHSPPRWAVLRKACLEVQILMSHLWTIKYFTFYMEILSALSATMAGVAANIVNNLLSLMSYQTSKGSSTR